MTTVILLAAYWHGRRRSDLAFKSGSVQAPFATFDSISTDEIDSFALCLLQNELPCLSQGVRIIYVMRSF